MMAHLNPWVMQTILSCHSLTADTQTIIWIYSMHIVPEIRKTLKHRYSLLLTKTDVCVCYIFGLHSDNGDRQEVGVKGEDWDMTTMTSGTVGTWPIQQHICAVINYSVPVPH